MCPSGSFRPGMGTNKLNCNKNSEFSREVGQSRDAAPKNAGSPQKSLILVRLLHPYGSSIFPPSLMANKY